MNVVCRIRFSKRSGTGSANAPLSSVRKISIFLLDLANHRCRTKLIHHFSFKLLKHRKLQVFMVLVDEVEITSRGEAVSLERKRPASAVRGLWRGSTGTARSSASQSTPRSQGCR